MNHIFSVATYNIELSKRPEKLVNNIKTIADRGATAICLQELLKRDKFIIDMIVSKLGNNWEYEYFIGEEQDYFAHGCAILWNNSVLNITNTYRILLPKMNKLIATDMLLERIAGFKGLPMQRRCISSTFSFNNKEIRITSLHLDSMGGSKQRIKQLSYLLEYLKNSIDVDYEIIAGDFNSFEFHEYKRLQDIFSKYGFSDSTKSIDYSIDVNNIDFSDNGNNSKMYKLAADIIKKAVMLMNIHYRKKLDYIWIKGLFPINSERSNLLGSDHYPLISTITT